MRGEDEHVSPAMGYEYTPIRFSSTEAQFGEFAAQVFIPF